jgi:hypothetical protein
VLSVLVAMCASGLNLAGSGQREAGSGWQHRPISSSAELTAALHRGGTIDLADGATFEGAFRITVNGTVLNGHGSTLLGNVTPAQPVLTIVASDVTVRDISATSTSGSTVIQCGANDPTQTTLEQVPASVTLSHVVVPSARAKRGIEYHCTGSLDHVETHDVYDPAGRDSQGFYAANTPGPIRITNSVFQAGSEPLLIGGDVTRIPGVVPSDIVIEDTELSRPLSWQDDGVKRKIKNLLELKTGRRVIARRLTLSGAWRDGQDGYAIVITPHSGGDIHDVTVEDVTARNVAGCLQFLGQEYSGPPTPSPLSGVVIRRLTCVASKAQFGGRGIFALITGEPSDITIADSIGIVDGTASIVYDPGGVLNADGTKRPGGAIGSLTLTGNYLVAGTPYGINLAGSMNGLNHPRGVTKFTVTGNTFADAAAALRKNLPNNRFVTREAFDALFLDASAGDYRLKRSQF